MTATYSTVNNHLVMHDHALTWRWYDAFGPKVTKWVLDPYTAHITTTTAMDGYTVTPATTGTVAYTATADGGGIVFASDATDNHGVNVQYTSAGFCFASKWPAYFGICLAGSDCDGSDFYVGLGVPDTTVINSSDGIYFDTADLVYTVNFKTEKTSIESAIAAGTLVDGVYMTLEWFFDGVNVTGYCNGVEAGSIAYTASTFPNVAYLTPTISMLTGVAASAATYTVKWARALQIREA